MGCGASSGGPQARYKKGGSCAAAEEAGCEYSGPMGGDAPSPIAWEDPVQPIASQILIGGDWQFEAAPGIWCAFGPEVSAQLLVAYYCGESQASYSDDSGSFDVDFLTCMKIDQQTGVKQRIGWVESFGMSGTPSSGSVIQKDALRDVMRFEYSEDAEQYLLSVWASGQQTVEFHADGCDYEVDFKRMTQTNLTTGAEQLLGVEAFDEPSPDANNDGKEDNSPKPSPECTESCVEWIAYTHPDNGQIYYDNGSVTTWERPVGPNVVVLDGRALTNGPEPAQETTYHENAATAHARTAVQPDSSASSSAPGVSTVGASEEASATHASGAHTPSCSAAPQPKPQKKYSLATGNRAPPIRIRPPPGAGERTRDVPPVGAPLGQALPGEHAHWRPPWQQEASSQAKREPPPFDPGAPSQEPHPRTQDTRQPLPKPAPSGPKVPAAPKTAARAFHQGRPPPQGQKRWSLRAENAAPRLAGQAPRMQAPHPNQVGAERQEQARAQAGGSRPYQPQQQPPQQPQRQQQHQPDPAPLPALPAGTEWPKEAKARRIAETLFRDMANSRGAAIEERQKAYRKTCLCWHPDKNPKHQELATQVFQFLQTVKQWYFQN